MFRKKIVVHYVRTPQDRVREGAPALLFNVVDHPSKEVSNNEGTPVQTSKVLRIHEDYFETENSIYSPIEKRP